MAERLWAPWRFEYVTKADQTNRDGCIFVDLPAETNDEENLILHRGTTAFVMLNAYPYTNGHLMVAPFRHVASIADLDDAELLETSRLLARSVRWIESAYKPEGFNIGINQGRSGGAGIPSHVHWHVVPRWSGDTNFMSTVADVRVIPQNLAETYRLLRNFVEAERWN